MENKNHIELENVLPADIESRSFEIIRSELPHPVPEDLAPVIIRAIHTSADFEYADSLCFSEGVMDIARKALKNGATIVTDTNMALAGINRGALEKLGCRKICFMADPEVAAAAKENGFTRAAASVDKAASINGPLIYAVGNAPTALIRLYEKISSGEMKPDLIIGVPVGFVNVVQAKELIMTAGVPYIVARGRKGGSNVAAAIVNALMYTITRK
ncbi:MAG: precorrin-8X methylmutase [Baileyella intestinalis]|uniref:precorrin-8X methylmutase n=1 Tax=Baileyella intestinalis TaxID=2606709 RepID=UPI0023F12E09|nr:precorrin-8X methylmutase [Baileyella intestinalis]MDD5874687.1 precorrin-8X methylmutase [Baileyella intestinalis]